MADVNTAIYGQLGQNQDPFALTNKLVGLQQGVVGLNNAQIENQLLQRNLAGQQAYQGALSDAVNPDGTIDNNKLTAGLRDTAGASMLPGAVQEGQKITGGNLDLTGKAQALNTSQLSTLGGSYGAALQDGRAFGRKEAMAGIMNAVSSGQMDPAVGNTLLHQMPRDDAGAKAWANSLYLRTQGGAGTVGTIGTDNKGAPIAGTAGQAFGKAVGAVQPDVAPAGANPPDKPAGTVGYVSGLAPGVASSADISARSAADQAAAFEKAANAATDNKATIANMQDQLGKVATGPYADRINNAKAGYNELADASGLPLPQFNKDNIAALDEFRKNGQILANQQFATLGGTGTDAQLQAAIHSNPGTYMSNLSNKQILQMLQGNQDAIEAKATAWRQFQQQNGAASNFNTFSEDFNRNFSPRAFQFVHMSPTERSQMVKGMTPVEKSQLNSALQTAMQRGWINAPGAGQ